jgi:hypothetical protein
MRSILRAIEVEGVILSVTLVALAIWAFFDGAIAFGTALLGVLVGWGLVLALQHFWRRS